MQQIENFIGGESDMIKYFCDKCGKECQEYEVFTIKINTPEILSWDYYPVSGEYILCFDCTKKLDKWLHDQEL